MAEVRQLRCPTCGAAVSVAVEASRTTCEYCNSPLVVEMSYGELALRSTEQIADAVREEAQRTQETLRRMELNQRQAQLLQDYTATRAHFTDMEAELRALQRATQSRIVQQQTRELQGRMQVAAQHLGGLQQQIAGIDATVNPQPGQQSGQQSGRPWTATPPPTPPRSWSRPTGGQGCLWALAIFFLFGIVIGVIGVISPFIVVGAGTLVALA